ncbi:YybH family protein [Streptomyces sp. NPDC088789]|uniref:YybH family protein n=1 Tax=Streptomyces sp. NPDC088789 TaxID=3365899 RepID=UPI0038196C6B
MDIIDARSLHADHATVRPGPLALVPEQHPAVFASAFNSGDPQALAGVYDEGAVFVPRPGEAVAGAEREAANAEFQALGLPISVRPRHTYVADDIALLIVDWVIEGDRGDGEHVRIEGTATDVVRRGPDGRWRYVIDNPFGVAVEDTPFDAVGA